MKTIVRFAGAYKFLFLYFAIKLIIQSREITAIRYKFRLLAGKALDLVM